MGALRKLVVVLGVVGLFSVLGVAQNFTVTVSPGVDLQSAVNANAPGTTFLLTPGVYRMPSSITPLSGDIFQGQPGAILNGSYIIPTTSFQQNGVYWQTNQPVGYPAALNAGNCKNGLPDCEYPQDLFFDNKILQHVNTLTLVTTGKWFFDYAASVIYVADNPIGHTVELSSTSQAFNGHAVGATVTRLIIEKYAVPIQGGAINAESGNWTITNNEIRLNHGRGVTLNYGPGIFSAGIYNLSGNHIHHNGQLGIGGYRTTGATISNNEIDHNNTVGVNENFEAGGIKVAQTSGVVIKGNYVHDNDGPGIWADIGDVNLTIDSNHVAANNGVGIFQYTGSGPIIENNLVENQRCDYCATATLQQFYYDQGGILLDTVDNAQVFGNKVSNNFPYGMGFSDQCGTDQNGTAHPLQNLNVHDNIVTQFSGLATGIESYCNAGVFTPTLNNVFSHNTYFLTPSTGSFFAWSNTFLNFTQWQAAGNDITGVATVPVNPATLLTVTVTMAGGETSTFILTPNVTSVNFGSVLLGSTGSQSVTLTNTGTGSVTVSSLVVTGGGFGTSGFSAAALSPGQTVTFFATFAPTIAGSVSGNIQVVSTATAPVNVGLNGTGTTPPPPPPPPGNLVAALNWTASTTPSVVYNIYRSTTVGGPFTKISSSVAGTTYTDAGLVTSQTYSWVVTAVNASGFESIYSNTATATIQ